MRNPVDRGSFSYLHEREHKRELRLESAQKGTAIAVSTQADLERTLLFGLRSAFVSTLQAKAVLQLAKDNLAYYDHVLEISRTRFKAGDIAQIDLDRLELQRVQYESDLETADVNLRTAKIHAAHAAERPHSGRSITMSADHLISANSSCRRTNSATSLWITGLT